METEAPPESVTAIIQLFLAHAPSGIVWWDDIAFDEIPVPGPRNVTIATIMRAQCRQRVAQVKGKSARFGRFLSS
jgi:hypothetical protein